MVDGQHRSRCGTVAGTSTDKDDRELSVTLFVHSSLGGPSVSIEGGESTAWCIPFVDFLFFLLTFTMLDLKRNRSGFQPISSSSSSENYSSSLRA